MHEFFAKVLLVLLFGTYLYGGGKDLTPAYAPVATLDQESSSWYVGAGFAAADFRACAYTNCSYEDKTYGLNLRLGYDFNPYLGIEARALRTFLDKGPSGGVPLQHIGLFIKPQYGIADNLKLYALLGYGYTQNLGNGPRLNYFDRGFGFSGGLGLEYMFKRRDNQNSGRWGLFFDYQKLLIRSKVPKMNVITLGLRYNF